MAGKITSRIKALDEAAALWREDEFNGALELIDKAIKRWPTDPYLRMQKQLMERALYVEGGICPIKMPPHEPNGPVVSVIMASWNRNTWIRESIESVIAQEYSNWELIVVNDGGGAELEGIVKSYKDPRIRYVYARHGGLSSALNRGLENARGKFIAFLDDDDIYYPDHLANLVNALDMNPDIPACYSDHVVCSQVLNDGVYEIKRKKTGRTFDFQRKLLVLRNYIQPNAILIRKREFERRGGFNERLSYTLDREMWLRLSEDSEFLRVPGATCEYRMRIDGSSMTTDPKFKVVHFSNGLITLYKGLLFESENLGIWKDSLNRRAMESLLDAIPDLLDYLDIREFFDVVKPYKYLLDLGKRAWDAGNEKLERAAFKAAVLSAPHEIKLWVKLWTGRKYR